MKRIDFEHQHIVREKAKDGNVCIFHDCGVGKTLLGLDIIVDEKAKGNTPALVVAPIRLITEAWIKDANDFYPDLDIAPIYHKDIKKRRKMLFEDHEVQVTNPETFKNHFDELMSKKFKVLVKDESSDLKDNKSLNTMATLAAAGFKNRRKGGRNFDASYIIPVRHPLTATPAPNNPSEFWAQVLLATGPGSIVFDDNFYVFRGRYFSAIDLGNRRKKWVFRKSMFEEFCYKLAEVAHVCRKKDVLDLPEQIHNIHEIELDKNEQRAYDTLKKDLVLRLKNDTILASTVLVELMKLRQITSGFIYGSESTHHFGMSKIMYLAELLKKNPTDQEIIWINFKEEARAMKHLPNSDMLTGDIPIDRQMEIIKDFKKGNLQYIVANQASISHGLTFVNCHRSTYFSMNYSYELMKQSRDRIHRIGQAQDCTYSYLLAKNTIDPVIRKANLVKEKMIDEFLGCLVDIQNGKQPNTKGCDSIFRKSHNDRMKQEVIRHLRA